MDAFFWKTHAMKVLFITRSLGVGGAQRQLCVLAKQFKTRGVDVAVAVFYSGGTLQEELVALGIPVIDLRKNGRWDVLAFSLHLFILLRKQRPDVVYAYLSVSNILAVLNKPFFPRMRVVCGVRASRLDSAHYHWTVTLLWRIECILSRFADLVICNSVAGLEHAAYHGFPREKMVVVHNGIDTSEFRPCAEDRERVRTQWGLVKNDIVIGLVARLDPMKDHRTFLAAAAELAQERDDVRFVCIGDGPPEYRTELIAHARRLGLDGRLVWAGARADMPATYCALDVCCSSSAFGEGFSNAIAEAMASGVPCVVTDVGDSARVVGDAGRVVPAGDARALKASMLELLRDNGLHKRLKRLSRDRVVNHFGLDALADATLRELHRVCGSSRDLQRREQTQGRAVEQRNDGRR